MLGISSQFLVNPFNTDRENKNEFFSYLIILATFSLQFSLTSGEWYNIVVVTVTRLVNLVFVLVNCYFVGNSYWREYKVYAVQLAGKLSRKLKKKSSDQPSVQ